MLKNNNEREAYIRDEKNWDIVNLFPDFVIDVKAGASMNAEGMHTPFIRVRRLKGTPVYKIEALAVADSWRGKHNYVDIGCKVFTKDGRLESVYDLTPNQLITWLREHKI